MDDKEFKWRSDRLEQVAKVLEKLPAEIRVAAFELVKGFVTGQTAEVRTKVKSAEAPGSTPLRSEEEFFASFDNDKPSENAKLIAAWFYREYGADPFSIDEIREKADAVGITIPARVDMTFLQAKEKGKKLFARAGTGKFKPTVHGEANLKATYSIKKGTKKRAEVGE